MNKLAIIVVLTVVICFLGVSQAQALSNTGEIAVTVTLSTVSIAITAGDETWAIGPVAASTETATAAALTVTNDGNVNVDIAIVCDGSTDWTIGEVAASNVFIMKAQGGEFATTYTYIGASGDLKLDLAPAVAVDDLLLQFTAPTASTSIDSQSITVTLTASAASGS